MSFLGIGAQPAPPGAPKTDDAAVREAARQLEGIFVNLMFEEMAKTVQDSKLMPEAPGSDMYEQWFRGAIAERWTAAGGTGLGDQIAASLGAGVEPSDLQAALRAASGKPGKVGPRPAEAAGVEAGFDGGLPAARSEPSSPHVRWPVAGRISSPFGERKHPVHGGHDAHRGVDIAVPEGTAVRLPFAGRVHEVGESPGLGRYVIVEHSGGYRSLFGHLSEITVRPGAVLRAGEVVAASGNTGRSTGPHLHYGLYRDGRAVDPTAYLE